MAQVLELSFTLLGSRSTSRTASAVNSCDKALRSPPLILATIPHTIIDLSFDGSSGASKAELTVGSLNVFDLCSSPGVQEQILSMLHPHQELRENQRTASFFPHRQESSENLMGHWAMGSTRSDGEGAGTSSHLTWGQSIGSVFERSITSWESSHSDPALRVQLSHSSLDVTSGQDHGTAFTVVAAPDAEISRSLEDEDVHSTRPSVARTSSHSSLSSGQLQPPLSVASRPVAAGNEAVHISVHVAPLQVVVRPRCLMAVAAALADSTDSSNRTLAYHRMDAIAAMHSRVTQLVLKAQLLGFTPVLNTLSLVMGEIQILLPAGENFTPDLPHALLQISGLSLESGMPDTTVDVAHRSSTWLMNQVADACAVLHSDHLSLVTLQTLIFELAPPGLLPVVVPECSSCGVDAGSEVAFADTDPNNSTAGLWTGAFSAADPQQAPLASPVEAVYPSPASSQLQDVDWTSPVVSQLMDALEERLTYVCCNVCVDSIQLGYRPGCKETSETATYPSIRDPDLTSDPPILQASITAALQLNRLSQDTSSEASRSAIQILRFEGALPASQLAALQGFLPYYLQQTAATPLDISQECSLPAPGAFSSAAENSAHNACDASQAHVSNGADLPGAVTLLQPSPRQSQLSLTLECVPLTLTYTLDNLQTPQTFKQHKQQQHLHVNQPQTCITLSCEALHASLFAQGSDIHAGMDACAVQLQTTSVSAEAAAMFPVLALGDSACIKHLNIMLGSGFRAAQGKGECAADRGDGSACDLQRVASCPLFGPQSLFSSRDGAQSLSQYHRPRNIWWVAPKRDEKYGHSTARAAVPHAQLLSSDTVIERGWSVQAVGAGLAVTPHEWQPGSFLLSNADSPDAATLRLAFCQHDASSSSHPSLPSLALLTSSQRSNTQSMHTAFEAGDIDKQNTSLGGTCPTSLPCPTYMLAPSPAYQHLMAEVSCLAVGFDMLRLAAEVATPPQAAPIESNLQETPPPSLSPPPMRISVLLDRSSVVHITPAAGSACNINSTNKQGMHAHTVQPPQHRHSHTADAAPHAAVHPALRFPHCNAVFSISRLDVDMWDMLTSHAVIGSTSTIDAFGSCDLFQNSTSSKGFAESPITNMLLFHLHEACLNVADSLDSAFLTPVFSLSSLNGCMGFAAPFSLAGLSVDPARADPSIGHQPGVEASHPTLCADLDIGQIQMQLQPQQIAVLHDLLQPLLLSVSEPGTPTPNSSCTEYIKLVVTRCQQLPKYKAAVNLGQLQATLGSDDTSGGASVFTWTNVQLNSSNACEEGSVDVGISDTARSTRAAYTVSDTSIRTAGSRPNTEDMHAFAKLQWSSMLLLQASAICDPPKEGADAFDTHG